MLSKIIININSPQWPALAVPLLMKKTKAQENFIVDGEKFCMFYDSFFMFYNLVIKICLLFSPILCILITREKETSREEYKQVTFMFFLCVLLLGSRSISVFW